MWRFQRKKTNKEIRRNKYKRIRSYSLDSDSVSNESDKGLKKHKIKDINCLYLNINYSLITIIILSNYFNKIDTILIFSFGLNYLYFLPLYAPGMNLINPTSFLSASIYSKYLSICITFIIYSTTFINISICSNESFIIPYYWSLELRLD